MDNLFNTDLFEQYKLDPALSKALVRLNTTTKAAMEELSHASAAMAQPQSFMQMGINSSQFFQTLDWMNVYKNFFQPNVFTQSMESFKLIQEAAVKKLSEGQQAMFKGFSFDPKNVLNESAGIDKPQEAIATYIEKSLDSYEDLKSKMAEQGSNVASVNAAYMEWVKQTLQALNAEPSDN